MSKLIYSSDLGTSSTIGAVPLPVLIATPQQPLRPDIVETTSWTLTTGGNFNTAADWSNGVPASGVDATIDENSNDSITVTLSAVSDTADSVSTSYAGLVLSNATLTLQGVTSGSSISTGTGTALMESSGLLNLENGPSENQTSSISSSGAAVDQTAGIIEVEAGTLDITGNSIFDGTLTGLGDTYDSGTIALLGSSTYHLGSGAVVSVGQLNLAGAGANLVLAGTEKLEGGFTEASGSTITLSSSAELQLDDLASPNDVLDGTVVGGIVLNLGVLVVNGATLDSNTTLSNSGTIVFDTGGGTALTLDTTGTTLPRLTNASGRVIDVVNGAYTIAGGSINNAGSIVLGNAADLTVTSILTDSGAISMAASDVFDISNSFTASGAISGAGTFQINGAGIDTISSTSTITAGEFAMNVFNDNVTLTIDTSAVKSAEFALEQGGLVNFATSLSYAGTFVASSNAALLTLNLGTSNLSLSGPASFEPNNFGTMEVTGTGTLATSGATTLEYDPLVLGNGVTFSNAGSLSETAGLQIGTTAGPADAVNTAAGVWDLLGNTVGITSNSDSTFTNAGLFENTGGSTLPTVEVAFVSTGTIAVAGGYEIDFYGGVLNSGTISGAGTIGLRGSSSNTFSTGSTISVGQISLYDNASLSMGTSLAYGGVYNAIGVGGFSAVTNLESTAVSFTGKTYLGNAAVDGAGTLTLSGFGTIVSGTNGLEIGEAAALVNSGTLVQDAYVQIGDQSGDSESVTNASTGTWTLATGQGLNRGSTAGVSFLNQGLFQNTDQGSTDQIDPVFDNTGTISIAAGSEIDFYNTLANAGLVSGAGTLGIRGSGSGTFSTGDTITVGHINLLDTGTLTLGTSLSYGGVFTDQGGYGTTLNLGGETLTLSGASEFGGLNGVALVGGHGTVSNTGTATVTNQNAGLELGGGAVMLNSGTVYESGQVQIGDASGKSSSITNTSTGTWVLATTAGLSTGSNSSSSFLNAGLFENGATGATQGVYAVFNNTGSVSIGTNDETDFYGATTSTGKITGTGTLGLRGSGTFTIGTGSTVSISRINLYDTGTLNLGLTLTYAGVFADQGGYGTTLNLEGHTLTLSSQSYLGCVNASAYVDGPGTLSVTGTSTITNANGGLELGTTAVLVNSGTVDQNGQVQIGDGSGDITSITNSAAGTWTLATGAGLSTGTNASSFFTNDGHFAVSSTGATQSINSIFNNAGSFSIATSDTVDFYTILNNTNTFSGPGTLAIRGSGQATFSAGSTITTAQLDILDQGTLTLGTSLTYAGFFDDEGGYGTTLALGSNTLSLTGTAYFGGVNGDASVGGSGKLTLSGPTFITGANAGLEVGGTTALTNTGTVTQNGAVQIGDGSGDLATVTNSAGAVWNIATTTGFATGSNASSSFTNAGVVENTGTGTDVTIGVVFDTTGTLDVASAGSTIALADGGSIAGTLAGAGGIDFDNGGLYNLAATTALNVAAIGIYNNSTDVTLTGSTSYGGSFTLGGGASLTLGGTSTEFTLKGTDTLAGTLLGTGTLVAAAGATVVTDGLVLGGSTVLLDSGLMAQSAALTLGNTPASAAVLDVSAGAIYEITGNATLNDVGDSGITNAGTFEMLAGGGTTVINPAFVNTGKVISTAGTLAFGAVTNNGTMIAKTGNAITFGSSVSTTGSASGLIDLTNGGLATFGGFVGSAETLSFTDGTSSTATLESVTSFDGTISGFGGENVLHLLDFSNATGSFSGGVLSLTGDDNGTIVSASLHFAGSYTTGSFDITSDNNAGSFIHFG